MLFSRIPKPSSFEKIRVQILSRWLLKKNQDCTVIALTSRLPREGVSTISTGLIKSFSSTDIGKTLLLNVSRKKNEQISTLNITDKEALANLSDYITHNNNIESDSLTLADVKSNSININNLICKLIDQLKKTYNLILIDAGTLNNSVSAYWLVNSDYNILIVDSSRTTQESLVHLKREFENSNIKIDASILNKRHFPIPSYLYWLAQ